MIYQLIYVSAATRPFSREQLVSLLGVSRRNNERDGLTGMLLYKDESFMQLLEGPRDALLATLGRIERDPTHTGIIRLIERETDKRQFSEWSMGFRHVMPEELEAIPGYAKLGDNGFLAQKIQDDPSSALRVLKTFSDSG